MNVSQITTAILSNDFSNDDLNVIVDAIKFKRARMTQTNIFTIRIGDNVQYNSRDGIKKAGRVVKVGRKNIHVNVNGTIWNVPANMLEKI